MNLADFLSEKSGESDLPDRFPQEQPKNIHCTAMTDIPGAVSVMVVKTSDGVVHKLVGVMRELL